MFHFLFYSRFFKRVVLFRVYRTHEKGTSPPLRGEPLLYSELSIGRSAPIEGDGITHLVINKFEH